MSLALPISRVLACRLILIASAGILLAGCAGKSLDTSASNARAESEIITDSDETPARKRARIRLELALGYFEQGKTTVALDEIKQALAIDPTFSDAFNLRGLVYMRLDDPGLAEDSFRRAIALNPRDANAMHNYGWLLCQQKRYGDATRIAAFDGDARVVTEMDALVAYLQVLGRLTDKAHEQQQLAGR